MTSEEEREPRELDPEAILAVLNRHDVGFVVIGGLACEVRGIPLPRTEDLDITPDRDEANLVRLSGALTELNARIRASGVPDGLAFSHSGRSLAAARVWNLVTDHGPIDLAMVPDGTEGYEDLVREAQDIEAFGVTVAVASLRDLIRSKEAAGREKDVEHLPILYQSLQKLEP